MKLTNFELRWARVAFGTVYPGVPEAGLPSIVDMGLDEFIRDGFRRLPLKSLLGIRIAVWVATFAPLFVIGRMALLGSLAQGEREEVLSKLAYSKSYLVRGMPLILKTIGAMLYAGHDAVRARMHAVRAAAANRPVQLRLGKSSHATHAA